ncbi:hypothetical protein MGMO_159c00030 [Methyloglobulus morosus KoM1]|uniref:Uncharacterized protein n=1 Tax=Methyloglobulus morosus KoM1 TaxID=1116472 RepID=V5DJY2_9GAMM|nr:hypothetical protein [Methyloglobulus morosus]ESS67726.1 hypothetical protein MGMO_159c00030 [Methyloglobulus morosus KoM1]
MNPDTIKELLLYSLVFNCGARHLVGRVYLSPRLDVPLKLSMVQTFS